MEKVINVIKWVLTIAFAAFCVLIIYSRFRYDTRYIQTGSMLPEYQIGALVWVDDHAYDEASPEIGDVAIYSTGSREVMHRIVGVYADGTYVFKGDNNDSSDFSPVDESAIEGKAVFHLNFLAPLIRRIHHLSSV